MARALALLLSLPFLLSEEERSRRRNHQEENSLSDIGSARVFNTSLKTRSKPFAASQRSEINSEVNKSFTVHRSKTISCSSENRQFHPRGFRVCSSG